MYIPGGETKDEVNDLSGRYQLSKGWPYHGREAPGAGGETHGPIPEELIAGVRKRGPPGGVWYM